VINFNLGFKKIYFDSYVFIAKKPDGSGTLDFF